MASFNTTVKQLTTEGNVSVTKRKCLKLKMTGINVSVKKNSSRCVTKTFFVPSDEFDIG